MILNLMKKHCMILTCKSLKTTKDGTRLVHVQKNTDTDADK